MIDYFETIKIYNGKIYNINYHLIRVFNTLKSNYILDCFTQLINQINIPSHGYYKLRIAYNNMGIQTHSITPYIPKNITTLKIVECNNISYSFKYEDRKQLNTLFSKKDEADDIIIVKNNFITDSSFSNLIFFNGKEWLTPATPLLNGTCRERLLQNGIIKPSKITLQNIETFKAVMLINAMLDFNQQRALNINAILK